MDISSRQCPRGILCCGSPAVTQRQVPGSSAAVGREFCTGLFLRLGQTVGFRLQGATAFGARLVPWLSLLGPTHSAQLPTLGPAARG